MLANAVSPPQSQTGCEKQGFGHQNGMLSSSKMPLNSCLHDNCMQLHLSHTIISTRSSPYPDSVSPSFPRVTICYMLPSPPSRALCFSLCPPLPVCQTCQEYCAALFIRLSLSLLPIYLAANSPDSGFFFPCVSSGKFLLGIPWQIPKGFALT